MSKKDYEEILETTALFKSTWQDKINPQLWPNWAKMYLMSVGMFTAAYDLLVINLVLLILTTYYGANDWQNSYVATSCILGTIIGQISGGVLADYFGRVRLSRVTCIVMIIGALGAGLLSWNIGFINLFILLAIWRIITGIGLGGEYPVGAIFIAEAAKDPKTRGTASAATFSAQGIGNLSVSVLFLAFLLIFDVDIVWRLALIVGAIPALFVLLPRFRLRENILTIQTNRTQPLNVSSIISDTPSRSFLLKIIVTRYWKRLIGTAGGWFIFDVVFYANSLFSSQILSGLGESIESNVAGNIVLALIALPGYWFAVFAIDRYGRRKLQLAGFAGMAMMYIIVGVGYRWIIKYPVVFILLYGMSYFFANAGPNTTNYVLPGESYPSKIRSTCHGFSAASGKTGAFLGSLLMKPLLAFGTGYVLILCGFLSMVGFVITWFFIEERMGKDLGDLEIEFNRYINAIDISDFE